MLSYSEKFIAIRRQLRLSQDALAEKLGVSGSAIGLIEQGKTKNPGADLLAALASKLGVSLDWVLLSQGEMFKSTGHRYDEDVDNDAEIATSEHSHIGKRKQPKTPFLANRLVKNNEPINSRRDTVLEGPEPQKDIFPILMELSEMIYLYRYEDEKKAEIIREYYEIIIPKIFKLASQGRNAHLYIQSWDFDRSNASINPNTTDAWYIIKNIPIGLYPYYPILNYIIDFADPYRRIAVFVEEWHNRWDYSAINYQDEVLALYGWKVFRIPTAIAKTNEIDLLPANLIDVYDDEADDYAKLQERRRWDIELSKKAMNSFFYWLKNTYFQDEIETRVWYRKRLWDGWSEGMVKYFFNTESDMLDKIIFGLTSSEWQLQNQNSSKKLRESATVNQLVVLASLENLNVILMKKLIYKEDRFRFLVEQAFTQFSLLSDNSNKNRISIMLRGIDKAIIESGF